MFKKKMFIKNKVKKFNLLKMYFKLTYDFKSAHGIFKL